MKFLPISYRSLNARQKEVYNFQRASSVLAKFGFATFRLTDDWNGADFIADHFSGKKSLRVQLKSRLAFEKKYKGKKIWICFPHEDVWYLFPHDEILAKALELTNIANTKSWNKKNGGYSFPKPPDELLRHIQSYQLDENDL